MQYDVIHFAYIKNSLGILRATVAYIVRKDYSSVSIDVVDFGITVVSPSEPLNKISYEVARNKATARCEVAHGYLRTAEWHDYAPQRKIRHSHGSHSAYEVIRKAGLQKIGSMDFPDFITKIKKVRKAVSKL
jgi:hypothetical protein